MQLQDELAQLKSELAKLRDQQAQTQLNYQQRLDDFAIKLEKLSQLANQTEKPQEDLNQIKEAPQTINDLGLQVNHQQLTLETNNQQPNNLQLESDNTAEIKTSNKPQFEIGKELTSGVVEQFTELVFSPFVPILSKIKSFYNHYQKRGLAAVFLMTVAGIITLTLGFSYLLQYSFNNWLSEIGKIAFAFISANTLLALGVYLYKRRAQMQDYASAIVGLGLIINYVSAYFSGPYFGLISDWQSLLLLLSISLFGFFISFKFKTKVVAVLSLVGGSLAPIMLFNETSSQLIYLPYLLLIGGCALAQSRFMRWSLLIELTAFLHIACVELFIVTQGIYFDQLATMPVLGLLSINLMFYLYGFSGLYWLNDSITKQLILNKRLLVLPIALFAFTLVSMIQLSDHAGYIFLLNALLFVIFYYVTKAQPALKVLTLFLAGSFSGFAALLLIKQDLLGIILLAEGLALLYLGCKEQYRSIRFEAYILIAFGLFTHFFALAEMLDLSPTALAEINEFGLFVLFLSISAATLYVASFLLKKLIVTNKQVAIESRVFTYLRECLNVNYVLLIAYIAAIINLEHALNVIPLISLLLLYLAQKEQLKFSELLAWIILLPLVAAVSIGIIDSGSARFSSQPLYAQLARIELFACFIGFYYWYKRFYQQSKWIKFARSLQLLCFFILPLLFLPKVIRIYPEYFSIALWLSVLINLALAFISRHRLLFLQAKILTVTAIVLTAFACLQEQWQGLFALAIAAMLFAYLQHSYMKQTSFLKLLLRFQWLLSPYYFALVAAVVAHSLMSIIGFANWGVVMATIAVYFTWLLRLEILPLVLRKSYNLCSLFLFLPAIATLLLHVENGLSLTIDSLLFMLSQLIILTCLWRVFVDNGVAIRLLVRKLPRLYIQWTWHILLSGSYLLWSYQFSNIIAAPLSAILLVIHGSSLMFVSLKPGQAKTIKLATLFFVAACCKVLFIDMANFLIVQKVIAFMLIGGILLAVSYFYQKTKNSQQ